MNLPFNVDKERQLVISVYMKINPVDTLSLSNSEVLWAANVFKCAVLFCKAVSQIAHKQNPYFHSNILFNWINWWLNNKKGFIDVMCLLFNARGKVEFREDLSSLSVLKAHWEKGHILSRVQRCILRKTKSGWWCYPVQHYSQAKHHWDEAGTHPQSHSLASHAWDC